MASESPRTLEGLIRDLAASSGSGVDDPDVDRRERDDASLLTALNHLVSVFGASRSGDTSAEDRILHSPE